MSAPLLLVTTTRAIWVLEVASGDAWEIDSGRDVYYGISSDGTHLYATARLASYGSDSRAHRNVILCFDAALQYLSTFRPPFPLRASHQLVYSHDQLWVVATLDDCVATYHLADKTWNRWYPFGQPADGRLDEHHINSIQFVGRNILLAGHKPGGWHARFDHDLKPLEGGKHFLGRHTHNVWQEDQSVWVCSTGDGAIVSSGGVRRPVVPGSWLRGVCRDGAMTYVGISRQLAINRGSSDSSVVALGADGKILDCFSFLGFGMIHDIRALDRHDVTHSGEMLNVDLDLIRRTKKHYQTSRQLVALT